MPIIEGQQTGRVVVASKIAPLTEISGDAVIYVDPYDITSMHKAYLTAITNGEMREKYISKGLENVKRFQVENIANQYMRIYKTMLS